MRLSVHHNINNIARLASKRCELASSVVGRRQYGVNGHGSDHLSTTPFASKQPPLGKDERPFSTLQERGILDSRNLLMFDTLHELQKRSAIAFAENPLFGTYTENEDTGKGEFIWNTYKEFGEQVDKCRLMLKNFGIEKYGKVGIIANNRWEWVALATASYSLNATLVPMYEAQLASDWTYIINDSGCSVMFCATQDIYDRCATEVFPQTPGVKAAVCLDAKEGEEHAFATCMKEAGKKIENGVDPSSAIDAPSADDLANLLYTSGTTGKPKGVELIHSNMTSNVKGIRNMVEEEVIHEFIRTVDRGLAILPWAHSYGQTCELWTDIAHGCSIGVCRGVPKLLEDLEMVRPTTLVAVPALFKRIYSGVHNTMEQANPIRKKLMKKAFELGRKNVDAINGGVSLGILDSLQFKALDKIVLSKIRAKFGGRLRHGFVAGAACPPEVIDFMDDIGIPICEGYGLTETAPIIAMNTPYDRVVGTVGRKLSGVEVVILGDDGVPVADGEEGEICCYGPNVMRGYYNNADATASVITVAPDGKSRLFHSGDLGCMTTSGHLKVTGRLKELYKLENGKYVCPTPIEEAIGMSRFVMQVVLCGANKPHNVALLVPDWPSIRSELKINESVTEGELVNDDRVKKMIDREVTSKCVNKVKKFEVPKAFAFVAPFTAANNMLTPKLSIRRHMVVKEYTDLIESLY